MARWEKGPDGRDRRVPDPKAKDDGPRAVFTDGMGGVSAFRKLREERESFGEPPPSADTADKPMSKHDGEMRKVNS